ncbi:MAG TPA: DUF4239 domain-containing protein [Solirubrobacteraceae bacterium]|nr:DUF4239 domain-containing protein [Solirubrobacteraceae bacterium]
MSRDLLNAFPTWGLGLIIVGVFVALGLGGLLMVRRHLLHKGRLGSNDVAGVVLGVMAAIYGVVLAFAVVALYEEFRATVSDVRKEATALSIVYRDSRGFPPAVAQAMRNEIGAYIDTVTLHEWPSLADGRESELAWAEIRPLYDTMRTFSPRNEGEKVFYDETVRTLDAFVEARRARVGDAESALPTPFVILLVGGGLLLLAGCLLFEIESVLLHAVLTVGVAVLIGFSLLLTLTLEYPFSGGVTVSPAVFHQGGLVEFRPGYRQRRVGLKG